MLLLHYFNMTEIENGNNIVMELVVSGETVLYMIDTINMMFHSWVLFTAKQFHFNFNLIIGAQFFIHLLDNLAITVIRLHWFLGLTDDVNIESNTVFNCAMTCSIFCITAAMCALPFLILERCFASFYLKDYETNRRKYISYISIGILNLIGVLGAYAMQNKDSTVFFVSGLSALNALAIIMCHFLSKWSARKWAECQNKHSSRLQKIGKYTLTRRYQLKENINSLTILRKIITVMGLMNIVLIAFVYTSSLDLSSEWQAGLSGGLDISILVYSFVLPQIMSRHCPKWRALINSCKERFGCLKWGKKSVKPFKDLFGEEEQGSASMKQHFDQLRQSWETT